MRTSSSSPLNHSDQIELPPRVRPAGGGCCRRRCLCRREFRSHKDGRSCRRRSWPGGSRHSTGGAASPGLVAAYSFDAGTGNVLADASGNNQNGSISGATWTAAGRNGGALTFDGTNDKVTIADHESLDLTTGMTLEAWVRPTALGGLGRSSRRSGAAASCMRCTQARTPRGPSGRWTSRASKMLSAPPRCQLNAWSSPGHDLRRHERPALCERSSRRHEHLRWEHPRIQRAAQPGWQLDLVRVVPRRARRRPHLQPHALRQRDPGRHGHRGRERSQRTAGRQAATVDSDRARGRRTDADSTDADLERRHRQRRRHRLWRSTAAGPPSVRPARQRGHTPSTASRVERPTRCPSMQSMQERTARLRPRRLEPRRLALRPHSRTGSSPHTRSTAAPALPSPTRQATATLEPFPARAGQLPARTAARSTSTESTTW